MPIRVPGEGKFTVLLDRPEGRPKPIQRFLTQREAEEHARRLNGTLPKQKPPFPVYVVVRPNQTYAFDVGNPRSRPLTEVPAARMKGRDASQRIRRHR